MRQPNDNIPAPPAPEGFYYDVFIGFDMQGDSCIYVKLVRDSDDPDEPVSGTYLVETELEPIAEWLKNKLNGEDSKGE